VLNHAGTVLRRVTIGSLPDDVLLEIFYVSRTLIDRYSWHDRWPRLVHVCRRWRFLIFASPHYLNLQLFCTPTRPVKKMLDIWPTFPLVIEAYHFPTVPGEDKLIPALERRDRVHVLRIRDPPDTVWEQITTVAQEPFPALTHLYLAQYDHDGLASSDVFLNGSAPNLQDLYLWGISIPRRLGSATHLRSLDLENIPNSGYIPPETMAISLSALPQLKSFNVQFKSPTPQPKRRNRPVPPPTRFVLPALTRLAFKGASDYLEVLTARINAPILENFSITFFHQIVFDIPQIIRFFGHQDLLRPSSLTLRFDPGNSTIICALRQYPERYLRWTIRCQRLDWQVFSLAQICNQILSFRSSVESLNIICDPSRWYPYSSPEDEIDPTLWLQLFHSFTSIQNLEISKPLIAAALPPLTGLPTADVLPSLQTLSVLAFLENTDIMMSEEAAQQVIQSFLTAPTIWSPCNCHSRQIYSTTYLSPIIFTFLTATMDRPYATSPCPLHRPRLVLHNLGDGHL
jgi:F-box-like